MNKKRMISGIQPTGIFTLGNYIGAIKHWGELQESCDCLYFIADLHALTVRQDPKKFKEQIRSSVALLLSCGLDPEKCTIFIQSAVSQHAELAWILSCYTQFGELSRMTQFKDKSAKHPENINAGLFTYPALMAADILLYNADLVPIGADQKQHLELTRNIAGRFNGLYGETFKLPDGYIPKQGARIMSLANPQQKMSKSDSNQNGCVFLLDPPEVILKKFRRAVTDSDMEVCFREGKDGINNLMTIYSEITGKTYDEITAEFKGKGYGDFKTAVGEAVANELLPIQEEYNRHLKDQGYLQQVCEKGAEKARIIAEKTLRDVYKRIGIL